LQFGVSSLGNAGVSLANKPLGKAAKRTTLPGLTHVKTADEFAHYHTTV
jgi:hypothetical protein